MLESGIHARYRILAGWSIIGGHRDIEKLETGQLLDDPGQANGVIRAGTPFPSCLQIDDIWCGAGGGEERAIGWDGAVVLRLASVISERTGETAT